MLKVFQNFADISLLSAFLAFYGLIDNPMFPDRKDLDYCLLFCLHF